MPYTPIISIVTPSYNQGEFIAETIESVLGQAGDFSMEYIIVDGGSTDDSVTVIRRYDELLKQGTWPVSCRGITFRWLSEKDRGQSHALMKGFRMAKGEIFAWLNSDDIYLPGSLQSATDFFRNHPETGLLYGDADYCDAGGNRIGRYRTEAFDFEKLAWFNFICQPSTFFRREPFNEVGGLNESLRFALDYDLWIRITRRFPCRHLPQVLSRYRLHDTSKTVSDATLHANGEEALSVAMNHFGWAPLPRVYNACHPLCRRRLPPFLAKNRGVLILATLLHSLFRSLRLNRGIRKKELRLLTRENFKKIFRNRINIMTSSSQS